MEAKDKPTSAWHIRPATLTDVPIVLGLSTIYLTAMGKLNNKNLHPHWQEHFQAYLQASLKQEQLTTAVIGLTNTVIGFCIFGWQEDPLFDQSRLGYIYDLYIQADQQGHGYGHALCKYAEKALQTANVQSISLTSLLNNQNAEEFWQRQGFQQIASRYEKIV